MNDRILASALFFASGALGLGYQLVWVRKAALVVGASQIALATVLTSFFLGMALGSRFVGRLRRSAQRSPLALYGGFELGIGLYALLFPLAFAALEGVYASLYGVVSGSAAALFALRFGLLFLLFLPPTFLMGGTLPLLLDGLVARDREVGPLASALYGINILGAVVGVLVTSYAGIPLLGMNGTSRVAGYANLAVGGLALALFRSTPPLHAADAAGASAPLPRFYLAAAFVSGLAAIGYQVTWARWFALFATGDVHVTALLLAVYLSALAGGSLGLSALLRRGFPALRVLALAQLAVPVLVFACLDLWHRAVLTYTPAEPQGSYEVDPSWRFASEALDDVFFAPLFQVALVIAPAVLCIGVGLPALVAAATARATALRAASGRLLFWNTLGASLGGFALGYAAIPAFGLAGALRALAALSLGLGLRRALARGARARRAYAVASRCRARARRRRTGALARPQRPGAPHARGLRSRRGTRGGRGRGARGHRRRVRELGAGHAGVGQRAPCHGHARRGLVPRGAGPSAGALLPRAGGAAPRARHRARLGAGLRRAAPARGRVDGRGGHLSRDRRARAAPLR